MGEQLVFTRPAMLEHANATAWARTMSRCRVEAVALEPLVDVLPLALQTNPSVKVILTWRDFNSWIQSTKAGGFKDLRWHQLMSVFAGSCTRMLPWIDLWDALTGDVTKILQDGAPYSGVGQASLREMICFYSFFRFIYGHPESKIPFRGTNKVSTAEGHSFAEEAYLAHMDEIRRMVPKERLLIFDIRKHGWDQVTEFLGLPRQPVGRKFPHPRSKKSFTNDAVWDHSSLEKRIALVAIFTTLHIVNYLVLELLLRAT